MSEYHDIEQGSEEWFNLRLGKITSSHFGDVMAFTKGEYVNAKWGEGAKKYALRVALERKTDKRIETFVSFEMERGSRLEPVARKKYENKTFQLVKNGGIFIDGEFATSPDGLVNKGGIEIKCPKWNTHYETLERGFDPQYVWQVTGQMYLAELDYVDFVSYCGEFPSKTELLISNVQRKQETIDILCERLKLFSVLVKQYESTL